MNRGLSRCHGRQKAGMQWVKPARTLSGWVSTGRSSLNSTARRSPRTPTATWIPARRDRSFRGDAAFARPELYEHLEAERYLYAIRLPANAVLHREIEHLLTRPVGRPPNKPVVWYHDFLYQAGSWDKPRRVVAKIEHHKGPDVHRDSRVSASSLRTCGESLGRWCSSTMDAARPSSGSRRARTP